MICKDKGAGSSMDRLPTDKVRPCIDLLDQLRSLGVDQDLALPAIAVIGDQSSGKSSVLEALSGVELPKGRKYPLVLQMKRTKVEDDWCGVITYQTWDRIVQTNIPNPEDVGTNIEEVKPYNYSVSSGGVLRLEISSPDVPNLTLIDLPSLSTEPKTSPDPLGIFPEPAEEKITSFIKSLIINKCIFILAVVPCNVTIYETEVMKLVKAVDPSGVRTLGLLTKPDLVDKDRERDIVDTVQNKVLPLKKGYMIVKCQDQKTRPTVMDVIRTEKAFFKDHSLFVMLYDDGYATVPKLAERLTQELQRLTEKSVPALKEQIKNALLEDKAELRKYGNAPPSDEAGRLTFLTDKVTSFTKDTSSLLTGDLLELKKIFSEWRDIVQNSEDTFCWNLEEEVAQYELKHSDRMQSGFINYSYFKGMAEEHIKLLEEPAVLALKDVAEIVKKKLGKLLENSFGGFLNLLSKSQSKISEVSLAREKAAESTLRMQFKMEQYFVHIGDDVCGNTKKDDAPVTSGTISNKCDILNNMMVQLKSYYHIASQRLAGQIPLVIRYQMLQELAAELQKGMLQMLQNKPDTSTMLKENSSINQKRDKTQRHFKRLTKARILLSEL